MPIHLIEYIIVQFLWPITLYLKCISRYKCTLAPYSLHLKTMNREKVCSMYYLVCLSIYCQFLLLSSNQKRNNILLENCEILLHVFNLPTNTRLHIMHLFCRCHWLSRRFHEIVGMVPHAAMSKMYGLLEFLPRLIEPGSAFRATTLELAIPFGIPDLVNSIIEVGYPI